MPSMYGHPALSFQVHQQELTRQQMLFPKEEHQAIQETRWSAAIKITLCFSWRSYIITKINRSYGWTGNTEKMAEAPHEGKKKKKKREEMDDARVFCLRRGSRGLSPVPVMVKPDAHWLVENDLADLPLLSHQLVIS